MLSAVLVASSASGNETITYRDLAARLTDLERLATPLVAGEKTSASTSHDRGLTYDAQADRYQNWSANDDGGGCIRREGDGQVMVDLQGPGVLWRMWSAKADGGHLRVYLDGNETPVIDKPFKDYFGTLEKELPGLAMTLSNGRNAFIPIPFAKSCKVVLHNGWGAYYHCTHTSFAAGTKVEPFPGFTPEVMTVLKTASEVWCKRGTHPRADGKISIRKETLDVAPGARQTLSLIGAGAIRTLKVKPIGLPDDRIAREDILRELTLAISWDGESKPSVWSPLGDFFATSPGLNPFKTLPMGCIDGSFYSYWHMPYAAGARIVITNDGKDVRKLELEIDTVALEPSAAAKLLRFCAAWHADDFTGLDAARFMHKGGDRWPDWPLLAVGGKGRFVGMSEHVWKFGGWWGEGDEKFFIDGEKFPSTIGTGSEDYIGYAWAANPPFVTFDSALAAVSRLRPDAQEDTSVCRFHVCDDLPFSKGFQGFIEVMPDDNCKPALYDTCVYWYREQGAENPYPIVPAQTRSHRRPARNMPHVLPSTFQAPPPKPGLLEGENMKVLSVGSGRHWVQEMGSYAGGKWSGNAQLIWTDGKQGDAIEIEFQVPDGGRRDWHAVFTKAEDYGVFELTIDGKPVGKAIDLFDNKVTTTGEIPLGVTDLAQGRHVLKATAVGQNPQVRIGTSGGYLFGLDYLLTKQR